MKSDKSAHDEQHQRIIRDLVEGRLAGEDKRQAESHLLSCEACLEEYNWYGPVWESLTDPDGFHRWAAHLSEKDPERYKLYSKVVERVSNDLKSQPKTRSNRLRERFSSGHYTLRFPRWLGAAGLASLIFSLILLMRWYPSELSKLAYVDAEPVSNISLPGRSQADLEQGSYKYWYHRGHALLRDSQFWIFDRVNRKKLDEGIRCLEKAKGLAEAAQDDGYVAQCYFYLGKAYLKRHDVAKAREQFEAFRNMKESSVTFVTKKREAEEILHALRKLEDPAK